MDEFGEIYRGPSWVAHNACASCCAARGHFKRLLGAACDLLWLFILDDIHPSVIFLFKGKRESFHVTASLKHMC